MDFVLFTLTVFHQDNNLGPIIVTLGNHALALDSQRAVATRYDAIKASDVAHVGHLIVALIPRYIFPCLRHNLTTLRKESIDVRLGRHAGSVFLGPDVNFNEREEVADPQFVYLRERIAALLAEGQKV